MVQLMRDAVGYSIRLFLDGVNMPQSRRIYTCAGVALTLRGTARLSLRQPGLRQRLPDGIGQPHIKILHPMQNFNMLLGQRVQ